MSTVAQERLLSLREAAALSGCSVATLRRRIREGALTAVRIGPTERSPIRVPETELERWLYSDPEQAA